MCPSKTVELAQQGHLVGGAEATSGVALEARELTIRFGGNVAVDAVSCGFSAGTLTAIVGPNGAGKTTFFNLLSGQLRPTSGTIHLFGVDITGLTAPRRAVLGIGRAFQLTTLFPGLTVLDNVRLALASQRQRSFRLFGVASRDRGLIDEAAHWLERTHLVHRRAEPAAQLSHGDQRKLEVAMLLAMQPRVFMFDEPTAGMSVDEVPVILDLIQHISSDAANTVLLVEHKIQVVNALADRILVLHNGALLADGKPLDVMRSDLVRDAYLGRTQAAAAESTQALRANERTGWKS